MLPLEPKTVAVELELIPVATGGDTPRIGWYTYTLAGASVVGIILGTVFAGEMSAAEMEYNELITQGEAERNGTTANTNDDRNRVQGEADDAALLATVSLVSAGVFGAAAVVTLILDLTSGTDEAETMSWSPAISPEFVGTAFQFRF